jgi:hypothetical protein
MNLLDFRLRAIILLCASLDACASEQVYFTKPGEWDPATLARDEAECETQAVNSVPYRRTFNNPFTTMFARGVLIDQTRDCLIQVHGWQTTKTVQHP